MRQLIFPGQLKGHRVGVVGCGRSGQGAVRLLASLGAEIVWLEQDPAKIREEVKSLADTLGVRLKVGQHAKEDFQGLNMLILSPGVNKRNLESYLDPKTFVYSELELASWFVDKPIIAVTGTNGKTTTTLILEHVLKKWGKRVFAGGNLGTPLSEYLLSGEEVDYLVLEVSSFQLQNCNSFSPQIGILLNFSPNHLDFHLDLEEYWEAKLNLFRKQKEKDLAILPFIFKDKLEKYNFKSSRIYFVARDKFKNKYLKGKHNQENLEAAYLALNYLGLSEKEFQDYIQDFRPPAHRLEYFWQWQDCYFIDDSKSTTVDSLRVALESVSEPIRLFCGGVFKGGDLTLLGSLIQQKVKKVYLFGESKEIFEAAFSDLVDMSWTPSLKESLLLLKAEIGIKENILLSPATASFDLFKDYKERGQEFKRLVKEIFSDGKEV